jgi:HSP20 family protein
MKVMTYKHHPFSRTFDSFFTDPFEAFAPFVEMSRRPVRETNLEWFEDDDHYHVRVDLPGVKKEELHLELESDVLKLSIEKKTDEGESKQYWKNLRVPDGISTDHIEAQLRDGVLTVSLAKAPEIKPRTIEVA